MCCVQAARLQAAALLQAGANGHGAPVLQPGAAMCAAPIIASMPMPMPMPMLCTFS